MMSKKITLSSRTIATLLGKSPWQTPWECFKEKVQKSRKFSTNAAMKHGLKYENEALKLYEITTGNKVYCPNGIFYHSKFEYISGKVDGILKENKAIIEVKCPYTKKFPDPNQEDWDIIDFYWIQCQIYMQILDINETHFCEYYKQEKRNLFRWKVIDRDNKWSEEKQPIIQRWYDEIKLYSEKDLDTHPIYQILNDWEKSGVVPEPELKMESYI